MIEDVPMTDNEFIQRAQLFPELQEIWDNYFNIRGYGIWSQINTNRKSQTGLLLLALLRLAEKVNAIERRLDDSQIHEYLTVKIDTAPTPTPETDEHPQKCTPGVVVSPYKSPYPFLDI